MRRAAQAYAKLLSNPLVPPDTTAHNFHDNNTGAIAQSVERFERKLERVGEKFCLTGFLPSKLATEFLGTLFLCLVIGLTGKSSAIAPLAIAFTLMCNIYAGGHISGGHYNPAVSIAVFVRGSFPFKELIPYLLSTS